MIVRLIAHTPKPERICGVAAKTCRCEYVPNIYDAGVEDSLDSAMESGHFSVLEHATFTFAVEDISRACSHQLVRHRMASYSQQSQRCVNMEGFEYVMPESVRECGWRGESIDPIHLTPKTFDMVDEYEAIMKNLQNAYRRFIRDGIPEEDARYILPMACTTNVIVTMNARELLHFIGERTCTRAQWEIRDVAERMLDLAKEACPQIFSEAGPKCIRLGYCPEKGGCGRCPPRGPSGEVSE